MGRHKKTLAPLKNYIRLQILADTYMPGTRLPAITTLGQKCQMKYNSARNALMELEAEGLLTHSHYHFTVNPWRKGPQGPRIAIFIQAKLETNGLYQQSLLGMLDLAFEKNVHFTFHHIPYQEITQEKLCAACENMDGAILLSSYDATLPEFSLPVPGTGVMVTRTGVPHFSTVNIDVEQAVSIAVGYFRQRHVQNAVIYSAPRTVFTDRGKAFARAFTEAGGNVLFFRSGNIITDLDIPEKCGIFCTSDYIASELCSNYARYSGGVRLPSTRPFLSVDGNRFLTRWPSSLDAYFATVVFDWQQAGYLALQELLRLIGDPGAAAQKIVLPGKLALPPRKRPGRTARKSIAKQTDRP